MNRGHVPELHPWSVPNHPAREETPTGHSDRFDVDDDHVSSSQRTMSLARASHGGIGFSRLERSKKASKAPKREEGGLHDAFLSFQVGEGTKRSGSIATLAEVVSACSGLEDDGACFVRGLLRTEARIAAKEAEEACKRGEGVVVGGEQAARSQGDSGRFLQVAQLAASKRREKLVQIVRGPESSQQSAIGIAGLASLALGTRKVAFGADDLFVKEPHATERTPWHRDLTAPFIAKENQTSRHVTIWMALDHISKYNSLRTIRGSHCWMDCALGTQEQEQYMEAMLGHTWKRQGIEIARSLRIVDQAEAETFALTYALEHVELVETNRSRFEDVMQVQSWDMEPGDCIIMHRQCIHGSRGNDADTPRRAYATRWSTEAQIPARPRYEGRSL